MIPTIPHISTKCIITLINTIYYKITNLLKYPIYPFFEHAILRVFRVFGLLSNTPSTIDELQNIDCSSSVEISSIIESLHTIRDLLLEYVRQESVNRAANED